MFCEVVQRFLHIHFQHVVDVLALEADLQRFAVEAAALADGARDPDVGQEIHLQPIGAVAFARLAAAAGLVEAESPRLVAANLRFGHQGEQLADLVENLDVGGRIGPRRPADRRLVDVDDLVDVLAGRRCDRSAGAGVDRRVAGASSSASSLVICFLIPAPALLQS